VRQKISEKESTRYNFHSTIRRAHPIISSKKPQCPNPRPPRSTHARRAAGRKQAALRKERIFKRLVEGGSYLAIARLQDCSVR
jgi:hypothetical protein